MGAIDRAEDASLGFVGDAIKKVGLFTIQFRQRQFPIAHGASMISFGTHDLTPRG